jgi:hypothetical protein
MIIDEKKVNLAEKDIEQWLWENPHSAWCLVGRVEKWLKRQYRLPSGIADLIGVTDTGSLVVVEVKNVDIDASALTQVCRYAFDLKYIHTLVIRDIIPDDMPEPDVYKVVIGRSVDTQTMREAEALDIQVICFQVNLSLDTISAAWRNEFREDRRAVYDDLSRDETWEIVAAQAVESWKMMSGETTFEE